MSRQSTRPGCLCATCFVSRTKGRFGIAADAVHIVNGKVNLVLTNNRFRAEDGRETPLVRGKIQIQSEGAEV